MSTLYRMSVTFQNLVFLTSVTVLERRVEVRKMLIHFTSATSDIIMCLEQVSFTSSSELFVKPWASSFRTHMATYLRTLLEPYAA